MNDSKPSKSARKRQFADLQQLGERLIELTDSQLTDIVKEQGLVDAVREARDIQSHGAMRRQKQLIGKIMRDIDAAPIRTAMEALGRQSQLENRSFKEAERWRDRMIAEGSPAIEEFRVLCDDDGESLERLLRDHRTAGTETTRKTAYRQIFREIHARLPAKVQKR
ncbi:MAG: ribosome biogenesis factor YjgA, partial [Woeseiaceae bacterium]